MNPIHRVVEEMFTRVLVSDLSRTGAHPRAVQQAFDVSEVINNQILERRPWAVASGAGSGFLDALRDFEQNYSARQTWPVGWRPVESVGPRAGPPVASGRHAVSFEDDGDSLSTRATEFTAGTAARTVPGTETSSQRLRPTEVFPLTTVPRTSTLQAPNTTSTEVRWEANTTSLQTDREYETLETAAVEPGFQNPTELITDPAKQTSEPGSVLMLLARLWTAGAPDNEKALTTTEGLILEEADLEPWTLLDWHLPVGVIEQRAEPLGVVLRRPTSYALRLRASSSSTSTEFAAIEDHQAEHSWITTTEALTASGSSSSTATEEDNEATALTTSSSNTNSGSTFAERTSSSIADLGAATITTEDIADLAAIEEESSSSTTDPFIDEEWTSSTGSQGFSSSTTFSVGEDDFRGMGSTTDGEFLSTDFIEASSATDSTTLTESDASSSSTVIAELTSSSTEFQEVHSSSSFTVADDSSSSAVVTSTSTGDGESGTSSTSFDLLMELTTSSSGDLSGTTSSEFSGDSSSTEAIEDSQIESTSAPLEESSSSFIGEGPESSSTLTDELDSNSAQESSSTLEDDLEAFDAEVGSSTETAMNDDAEQGGASSTTEDIRMSFSSSTHGVEDELQDSSSDMYHTSTSSSSPFFIFGETTTTQPAGPPPPDLTSIRHTYMKEKTPLEALVAQTDMRMLANAVQSNDQYETLRLIGMTLFVPTDAAFSSLPFDIGAMTVPKHKPQSGTTSPGPLLGWDEPPPCLGGQSIMRPHFSFRPPMTSAAAEAKTLKEFEELIMFHVVRRQIPPGMIAKKLDLELRTEMQGALLPVHYTPDTYAAPVVVGTDARVTEVVHCKKGFLYKLDRPLTPSFNPGAPTLMEFLTQNHKPGEFSKLLYLLKHSHLFEGWVGRAGPITVLLIRDDGWRVNGLPVPDCFFKALVRPSNRDMLLKILRWVTIPGIWSRSDIEKSQWLMNAEAPALMVNHIANPQAPRGDRDSPVPPVILIEGKEVVEWNIPLHNGLGHVIAEMPMRPDIDLTPILWDCLDFLCTECPIVTKYVLKWLDNGGLLPDVSNPKAYIIPNGVRPDWVCGSNHNWFPAGWDLKDWKKYIENAQKLEESGHHGGASYRSVQKMAKEGWTSAAAKREKLLDQYEEARLHLKRIWAHYSDTQNYVVGRREDSSMMTGFLSSHRDLAIMPKICSPRERLYKHRNGFPQQGGVPYLPENADEDGDLGLDYEDWKYITQWI